MPPSSPQTAASAKAGSAWPEGANSQHWPTELIRSRLLADGRCVTLRPILPQDAPMLQGFTQGLCAATRFRRFRAGVRELGQPILKRLTQIDFRRDMALVATVTDAQGQERIVADVRYVRDDNGLGGAEFALCVGDAMHGLGLGRALLLLLDEAAAERGIQALRGEVLDDNQPMLGLLRSLGWRLCDRDPLERTLVLVRAVGAALPPREAPAPAPHWQRWLRSCAAWVLQHTDAPAPVAAGRA